MNSLVREIFTELISILNFNYKMEEMMKSKEFKLLFRMIERLFHEISIYSVRCPIFYKIFEYLSKNKQKFMEMMESFNKSSKHEKEFNFQDGLYLPFYLVAQNIDFLSSIMNIVDLQCKNPNPFYKNICKLLSTSLQYEKFISENIHSFQRICESFTAQFQLFLLHPNLSPAPYPQPPFFPVCSSFYASFLPSSYSSVLHLISSTLSSPFPSPSPSAYYSPFPILISINNTNTTPTPTTTPTTTSITTSTTTPTPTTTTISTVNIAANTN